ncbi:unnamed protein product [Musa acuminata subsp. malaccensis]|uniref:(wild Malaysian banana) hypothetical protein n=1 Tax=Musa acuminata subsp. malaccensis TaxID=214687 RepID=A0A804IJC2_MUSAM|nr:PREDICTED: uncharacterized protein LOC103980455 [Musa acuminata subsp. malaccensis]CAG1840762.1 unnamed protein product [Musa acuminata subsp. malaccensis]
MGVSFQVKQRRTRVGRRPSSWQPLSHPPQGTRTEFVHLKEEERERERSGKMCPLRVLLILLSATLAGFFVLRNLKPQPELNEERQEEDSPEEPLSLTTKVGSAISTGFWTCVDMASGRYLWRILMTPSAAGKEKKAC